MRVFISWSGHTSKHVAEELRSWLADVLYPELQPWVSGLDIAAGARWEHELTNALAQSGFGILCLTRESLGSPWLLFEAGALSKSGRPTSLVPYLLGLSIADLPAPLQQFQTVEANREGTFKLTETLNGALTTRRAKHDLDRHFEQWWPRLAAVFANLPPPSQETNTTGGDLPVELTQSFLARRESIGRTQEDLLRILLRHANQPDQRIDQQSLLRRMRRTHSAISESELYYRLEHLRLLGFITKDGSPTSGTYTYNVSAAYRREREK